MRRESLFAALAYIAAALAAGQDVLPPAGKTTAPAAPTEATQAPTATAYYAGPGIVAPELGPLEFNNLVTGPCKKLDGTATISAIVNASGMPVTTYLLSSTGGDLDQMALSLVAQDSFTPGKHNGSPAAIVIYDEITLHTCAEITKLEDGEKRLTIRLRSVPQQKISVQKAPGNLSEVQYANLSQPAGNALSQIGGRVSAPIVLHTVEAEYSSEARFQHIQGTCIVSLIVDRHGMPQNIRIVRSLGHGLDANAIEAVRHYRFKPAMKDGITPVPVMVSIEVIFRLY